MTDRQPASGTRAAYGCATALALLAGLITIGAMVPLHPFSGWLLRMLIAVAIVSAAGPFMVAAVMGIPLTTGTPPPPPAPDGPGSSDPVFYAAYGDPDSQRCNDPRPHPAHHRFWFSYEPGTNRLVEGSTWCGGRR